LLVADFILTIYFTEKKLKNPSIQVKNDHLAAQSLFLNSSQTIKVPTKVMLQSIELNFCY